MFKTWKKRGKQEFCYRLQVFEGSKQAKLRSMERAITSQEFNIKVIAVGQGKTLRLGNWTSHIIEALWNNVPVNDQYLLESMRSDLSFFFFNSNFKRVLTRNFEASVFVL